MGGVVYATDESFIYQIRATIDSNCLVGVLLLDYDTYWNFVAIFSQ